MFEQPTSRIYELSLIDAEDEFELELSRLYAKYQETAKNKSEIEIHNYLQDKASQNKREYNEVVSALLYGVLTEPGNARSFFQSISFVNRDNFSVLVNRLQVLCISIKFQQVKLAVREQILKLCEAHKSWLDVNPRVIATFVYTYLRVIADHKPMAFHSIQQREIRFTTSLLREKVGWICNVVAANIKLALIYDWLFFTSNDNIMFIEPAMLLMERSAERYPYITAMLMEFLKYAVDEYYPPMKEYMAKCVSCGMKVMLSKGVIRLES
ncbi:Integrator complex subunit 3 [Rhizopus azygosporus]|uniref:Integrator complex subunit 3 n=1 Tax=Rhizopus azygosporus TaxID=86630 RepID=A0A367KGI3_RHIAZ|nr:Integrator complex subunit 3 [Rhizopus azygosporus]